MLTTIQQTESLPADYPDAPDGLSTAAAALDSDMIWQRIETYIAHRWTSRDVTWVVEGCGEWHPPLTPATMDTVEVWSCGASEWETAELDASPLGGYYLPASGPYRFSASVGGGVVPAAVDEAFRRLAEYFAAEPGAPGAASEREEIPGVRTHEVSRVASWMARAMQNSGAGDLLRPYRRA
ncbi:MAG: hypothetical protein Q8M18_10945 [Bradyrhizobium sp.]|nr:hypothetical protein [Bradyrhizobium sp.]